MTKHMFDVKIATAYDISIAVFLENLAFWTLKNRANRKHFYEDRYWVYNSQHAFTVLFPYFSRQNIRTVISNCIKNDLIVIGNFNKSSCDKTTWYALTEKALLFFPDLTTLVNTGLNEGNSQKKPVNNHWLESTNGRVRSNQAIPDSKQDSKQKNKYIDHSENLSPLNSEKSPANSTNVEPEYFDSFWKEYPVKKGKAKALKSWIKKNLDAKFETIIEKLRIQKQKDIQWKNQQYIPHGDTYVRNELWEDEIQIEVINKNSPSNDGIVSGKGGAVSSFPPVVDDEGRRDAHDRRYGMGKYSGQKTNFIPATSYIAKPSVPSHISNLLRQIGARV